MNVELEHLLYAVHFVYDDCLINDVGVVRNNDTRDYRPFQTSKWTYIRGKTQNDSVVLQEG